VAVGYFCEPGLDLDSFDLDNSVPPRYSDVLVVDAQDDAAENDVLLAKRDIPK
jgi:hypothetical protein